MTYLVFMNYIMLVAICRHMGIIVSDITWFLNFLGFVALIINCGFKSEIKKSRKQ